MKILITDPLGKAGVKLLEKQPGYEVTVKTGLSKAELLRTIGGYDALIVRSGTKADRDVIKRGTKLRVIGRAGVGTDNIDIDAASRQRVMVTNTPDANTLAAAEHTLAILLAFCRNIPAADQSVKAGQWDRKRFMGRQLYGKTLGVIGLGRIGQQVSLRAQAFGMDVLAHDPYVSKERAAELGLKLVPLPRLLKQSDFVTLHAPTSEATRGLMSAENLARMKRGACLVNCARGTLVDEQALADALKSSRLGGAAIDVYQQEPPKGSPLLGLDNVVLTPHLAASTTEAQSAVSVQVARQVIDILDGAGYDNVLNLPFLGRIAEMRPHLSLSERVGSLSAQILGAPASRVEWDYSGGPEDYNDGVEIALLRGILEPQLGAEVNFINAGRIAADNKLKVSRVEGLADARDHVTVACRLVSGRKARLVVGALVGSEWLRIVQIDGYRLEAEPTGDLLFTVNRDVPGVIGKVGTLLGKAGVNIGEWRLGRDKSQKKAVTLINLDSPLPARTLAALRRLGPVLEAHRVHLGNDE